MSIFPITMTRKVLNRITLYLSIMGFNYWILTNFLVNHCQTTNHKNHLLSKTPRATARVCRRPRGTGSGREIRTDAFQPRRQQSLVAVTHRSHFDLQESDGQMRPATTRRKQEDDTAAVRLSMLHCVGWQMMGNIEVARDDLKRRYLGLIFWRLFANSVREY